MKVIIFGGSGMVGQGVLRECLLDERVEEVLLVGRSAPAVGDPRVKVLVHADFTAYEQVPLAGYDACFFCLGVSAVGMKEPDYRHITYDFTLAAARALQDASPEAVFIYVSGAGTGGRNQMWSRVKGETEQALLDLPITAYMFRPGIIQPLHGIVSKTRIYRIGYRVFGWLAPVLNRFFPSLITTTEQVGLAMLHVARDGWPEPVLENSGIKAAAAS